MSWYDDRTLLAGLASALIEAGVLEDTDEYKDYLNRPMRYNYYYNAWSRAKFPSDESDEGWEDFIESISAEDYEDDANET